MPEDIIFSQQRRRRQIFITTFDYVGGVGYRVRGSINNATFLERDFYQDFRAHEAGQEFLNDASFWDAFIHRPSFRVRHGKY